MNEMSTLILWLSLVGTLTFIGCARPNTENMILTQEQALERGLSVPKGSTNIYFASASVGMGGRAVCFRLHASVPNMLSHLQNYVSGSETNAYSVLLLPIKKPDMCAYGLGDISWFDVENIKTGYISYVTEHNATVWVDAERCLYYYYWTD